ERRPGDRRPAGGAGRELALPAGQTAVARDPHPHLPAGAGYPTARVRGPGGETAGVVRRALDHLDVRPLRGERAPDPGADPRVAGDGRAAAAHRGLLPAPARTDAPQQDRVALAPADLRPRPRRAAPAAREPPAAGGADARGHGRQRRVLLRDPPFAGPRAATAVVEDELRAGDRGVPAVRPLGPGGPGALTQGGPGAGG